MEEFHRNCMSYSNLKMNSKTMSENGIGWVTCKRQYCTISINLTVTHHRLQCSVENWSLSRVTKTYGANHLVTAACVQAQNHFKVKKYTSLLYMGINRAIRSKGFDAMWPHRATRKNCTCIIQHFGD